MLYPLEYKSNRVLLTHEGIAFELFENMSAIYEVRRGETIGICSWCDKPNRDWTKKLKVAGYDCSHGICKKHLDEQLKQLTKE